ncbi:ABC transporter substrate-binding protein/permease [Suicoccus acidiformans]
MMNLKKSLRWLLMSVLLFLSVGQGLQVPLAQAAEVADVQLEIDQDALEEGLETPGVLRIGMEANYAPFNWSQAEGTDGAVEISNSPGEYANGYDLQIAKRLADTLNLDLEIVKLEWDGLPPALESGKIDGIIAGMTPTPERMEQIDFSEGYYESDLVLVVRKDSPFAEAKRLDDFAGARVTGQLNTFHYDMIEQIPDVIQQTAMDSFPTMIQSVLSDKSDAYVSERPGAMAAVAANDELTFVAFDAGLGFDTNNADTTIAVGLRKHSPLTGPINQALATISANERNQLMENMVELNERGGSLGFWDEVRGIWNTYRPQFMRGIANTMIIALISTTIGFLIGLIIAIYRSLPIQRNLANIGYWLYKILDFFVAAYIEIFRGTPMMVQAMLIFYGSKLFFNIDMTSMSAALLIVSVNTGAYLAEVIRGGIIGVDKGQYEGAKAIGMNHFQTMVYVVLPQAIRSIMPALGNEFVINIKDTSVLNVIAVAELFFVTKSAAGSTYLTFQTYFIASVIYFILTFVTTRVLNWLNNRGEGKANYTVHTSSTMSTEVEVN